MRNSAHFLSKLSALCLLAVVAAVPAKAQLTTPIVPGTATPIKILPLGDSITMGYNGEPTDSSGNFLYDGYGGYRYRLEQELTTAGYNFEFVGSVTDNTAHLLPKDQHQEGHNGNTIQTFPGIYQNSPHLFYGIFDTNAGNSITTTAVQRYNPDVILLLIGTNNVNYAGQNPDLTHPGVNYPGPTYPDSAINQYTLLLNEVLKLKPNITILLGAIPHPDPSVLTNQIIQNQIVLNNDIQRQAALLKRLHYNIAYVPGTAVTALLSDNTHPTQAGYDTMADAWYTALTGVTPPATPPTP